MELKTVEEIIGALERGKVAIDFADTVKNTISHLYAIDGGKAAVTLKLDFTAKADMVSVKAEITHKLPKEKRRESSFFMTDEGCMSTKHPNQMDMLGAPETKRPAAKTINA